MADAKSRLDLLRRGCCHPQVLDRGLVVGGSRGSNSRGNTSTTTASTSTTSVIAGPRPLDELMIAKVEQSHLHCEELLRTLLFHLYSMAGAVALQAQCRELDINMGSDISSGSSTDASSYLIQAYILYSLAVRLIQEFRHSVVVIGMMKVFPVGGGGLSIQYAGCERMSVGEVGVVVPHEHQGVQCCWTLPSVVVRESSATTSSGSSGSIPNTVATTATDSSTSSSNFLNRVVWRTYTGVDSILNSIPSTYHNTTTSASLLRIPIQHQPSVRFMFSNARRITSMKLSVNIPLQDCGLTVPTDTTTSSSSTSSGNTSNTSGILENIKVFLFPAVVELQVGVSMSNIEQYMTIRTVAVPFPSNSTTTSSSNTNIDSSTTISDCSIPTSAVVVDTVEKLHRSKRWQLRVTAYHTQCIVLRYNSLHRLVEYAYVPVTSINELHSTYTTTGTTAAASSGASCPAFLGLQVVLEETGLDADGLQELHACHNLTTLPTSILLPLQQQYCKLLYSSSTGSSSGRISLTAALRELTRLASMHTTSATTTATTTASATSATTTSMQDNTTTILSPASATISTIAPVVSTEVHHANIAIHQYATTRAHTITTEVCILLYLTVYIHIY